MHIRCNLLERPRLVYVPQRASHRLRLTVYSPLLVHTFDNADNLLTQIDGPIPSHFNFVLKADQSSFDERFSSKSDMAAWRSLIYDMCIYMYMYICLDTLILICPAV